MNLRPVLTAVGVAGALACAGAQAEPARYRLDPAHSIAWFEVLHFGTSTLRGRFGPLEGEVMLDREAGRGEVGLRIATAGVWTGVRALDRRLAQPDLFDSAAQPEAYFVATRFRFDGGRLAELTGEFTLRGSAQPLTLRALRFACRSDPARGGAEVCGGDFEGELRRSDFGMSYGLPFVADRVRLVVQAEGVRQ